MKRAEQIFKGWISAAFRTRRFVLPVFFLAMNFSSSVAGDMGVQAFDSANAAYQEGDYRKALNLYLGISAEYESVSLAYNIGNTCYKLDSIPASILWLERAKILDPGNEDVLHNLALAKQRTYDKIETKKGAALQDWWRARLLGVGSDRWASYSLFAILMAAIAFAAYRAFRIRNLKLLSFLTGASFVLAAIVLMMLASFSSTLRKSAGGGVIFAEKVDVSSSPSADGTQVFNLHEGCKVDILKEQDDWMEIMLEDGKVGWIQSSSVIRI